MAESVESQGKGGGLFSALGFSFSTPRAIPGTVRQVRGAAYPPLQAPLGLAEAAGIAAAR